MKINELTKFAITLGLLPWIPAFLLYKHSHQDYAVILLVVFLTLSLISFLSKKFAHSFKSVLTKVGNFLGKYIAIFVLACGYIIAVVPTGLLMKVVKRDRLRLKKPDVSSYWKNYENSGSDYEFQF